MKKISLIGFGKFGREYYKELINLESQGIVKLRNVLYNTNKPDVSAEEEYRFECMDDFDLEQLSGVDAVFIVTPPDTHYSLVKKVSNFTNVLVEKPVCTSIDEIEDLIEMEKLSNFAIVPAHCFRFNPLVEKAKELIERLDIEPNLVEGCFLNKLDDKATIEGKDPSLEMLHYVDVLDLFFDLDVTSSRKVMHENSCELSIRYDDKFNAVFQLGWVDSSPSRFLKLNCENYGITIDFLSNVITISDARGAVEKVFVNNENVSLSKQIRCFIDFLDNKAPRKLDLLRAKKIVKYSISNLRARVTPRVAVIGGGVFGTNCALEISKFANVELFEKNNELLREASFFNQWRHHSGFHYPISYETVKEIEETKHQFEELYMDAIRTDIPSFYCISAEGKEIPAERYLASCDLHKLNYKVVATPEILAHGTTTLSVLSDEGLYDVTRLRQIIKSKIEGCESINLRVNSNVYKGQLEKDGTKTLFYDQDGALESGNFDYVINCSYANWHKFSPFFGFPTYNIRLEDVELIEIELNIPPQSITLIDAPFMSLTSTGEKNRFFLSHRDHSVLSRKFENEKSFNFELNNETNKDNILNDAKRYMPILESARYIKSWRTIKAISAFESEFWARPTVLKNHGFGYWSVLGGKVLTSVANAREVAREIKRELR